MNHWASCCNTKLVQEASVSNEYLIEAITRNEDEDIHIKEATLIFKINGKLVKAKLTLAPKREID